MRWISCFALAALAAWSMGDGLARVSGPTDAVPGMLVSAAPTTFGPPVLGGDIPQMPGWPLTTGRHQNFVPARGMVFADLDGDRDLEILVPSTDGKLNAWHHTGVPVAGFPITTVGFPQYPPSVGDIDGDGDLEIVQTTRGFTSGGRLYAFNHLGQALPGFPKSLNNNNVEYCATLADLNRDGDLEIIVGERASSLGRLHVFNPDGTEWGGNWPVQIDHVPTMTAAVGDVDRDGSPEIFYPSYTSMYLLRADGTNMPGWPRGIPNANFSYQSAALADLDGDGDLEIMVGAHGNAPGFYAFHHDGNPFAGWPKRTSTWTYCPPTIADLEGDGSLEIIGGQAGGVSGPTNAFWVWNAAGQIRSGFPFISQNGGGSEGPLTTADIDGDGVQEIFADSNIMVGGQGFLYGVNAAGQTLPGFPLRTNGFTYLNSATIGDVDGDGDYELGVIATGDIVTLYLYDLPDRYRTTGREWPTYHARNTRGGLVSIQGRTATLTDLTMVDGSLVSGGLDDLRASDNVYANTLGILTPRLTEPQLMRMIVGATTDVGSPSTIDLAIEGKSTATDCATGVWLKDWGTGQFEEVARFGWSRTERTDRATVSNAGRFVRADGRIEVRVRQVVALNFTVGAFGSSFDWLELKVR